MDLDAVFDVLAEERRRYLLYYLDRRRDPVAVDELARRIVAWEEETPVREVTAPEVESVATSLVHNHLPKLARGAFVAYDEEADVVELVDPPRDLAAFVSLAELIESPNGRDHSADDRGWR